MMPPPPRSTLVPYPTLFLSHLTLGTNPTGTISFTLYSDAGCTVSVFTSSATVDHGNGDYSSGPFTATQAGTYHWRASYTGDLNNNSRSEEHTSELHSRPHVVCRLPLVKKKPTTVKGT